MSDRNGFDANDHMRRRHPAVDRGHQVLRDSQGGGYPPSPYGDSGSFSPSFIENGFDGMEDPKARRDQTGRRAPRPTQDPRAAQAYPAEPYGGAEAYPSDPYAADQTGGRRPAPDASRLAAGRRTARAGRPEPRAARDGYDEQSYGGQQYGTPNYDGQGYDGQGYDGQGQGYNGQSYDNQGYDNQGYDGQGYGGQQYGGQGYDNQGYDSQGYNNQGYNNQGYNNQGYNNQGYDAQGYDAQGYDAQGYDAQGYDRQGYANQGYANQGYANQGYPNQGYEDPAYSGGGGYPPAGGYEAGGYESNGRGTRTGVYGGGNGYESFDEVADAVGAETPRRRGRSAMTLALVIILFAAIAGVGFGGYKYYENHFTTPDYPGPGTGTALVLVHPGDSATIIANTLVTDGVVKSTKAFIAAATANPNSQKIQVGEYKLKKQMSAVGALNALLATDANGKLVNLVNLTVTIPEGDISVQIYSVLSAKTGITVADFKAAAADPEALGVPSWWFANGSGSKSAAKIEGFLYPDTYAIQPGSTAKQILTQMVKEFNTVTDGMSFRTKAAALHVTPYQALIAASIAQEEAKFASDMGPVSRVLYNRVQKSFACNCFEVDSSINYWLKLHNKPGQQSKSIGAAIADASDPYNTYKHAGWPPGPIGSPGKSALTGAATAPSSGNFFFVTIDKAGHMAYAKTASGHAANIRKACANGVTDLSC